MTKYNCSWVVDFLPNRTEYAVYERGTNKILLEGITIIDVADTEHVVKFIENLGVNVFNYKLSNYNVRYDIANYSGKGIMEVD
jgi:hypothetical protein